MMKIILFLSLFLGSISAWAGKCEWSDATVEFVGSTWNLTPKIFYAKEGDRLCVKFSTVDNSKTLMIQNTPLFLRAYPNKGTDEGLMIVRKVGTYKVTCNGCETKSEIVVQSKAEFDAYQRKMERFNSLQNRNNHPTPGK